MTMPAATPTELRVSLWIDAPTDICWHILTQRTAEWWCPTPWYTTIEHWELFAGGRCTITMHGPNGESHPSDGLFIEVVEGRRIVSTDALMRDSDGMLWPQKPFMLGGWEVTPDKDGTLYRAWARHWTEEDMAAHKQLGFTEGWMACARQFQALCEAEKASPTTFTPARS